MKKANTIKVRYNHALAGSGIRVKFDDGKSVTFTESFEVKVVDEQYREVFERAPDFEIIDIKTTTGGKK